MTWQDEHKWHSLSTGEVTDILESDTNNGLSKEEVERRLELVGPNVVATSKGPGAFILFLQQFQHPLIYILLVAGTITLFLPGHLVDAAVIFGVVLVNAIVGFIQESKAKAAIEALSKMISVESMVIREGQSQKVDAAGLVPGDVVLLQSGDRVPADLRFIRVRDLHVDESMLTGESLPVAKEFSVLPEELSLADRKNMGYSGALITFGQATGVVIATAGKTELGRISHLIESATSIATPLTKKLTHFSKLLSWVIIGFATLTFILGTIRGESATDMFIAAVALSVAAIPEGLPAAVTIILAIGVTRMAHRNAVIRKLPAVETLGSTSVICSDKTGTLTKNEMTITAIIAGDVNYTVSGTGYSPEGKVLRDNQEVTFEVSPALHECLKAGVLCNESRIVDHEGVLRVEGDPTEGSLLPVAQKAGINPGQLRDFANNIDVIPFESERQFMATLHHLPEDGNYIYLKGAVERVLNLCNTAFDEKGSNIPIDREKVQKQADELASEGLRVLAFAMKKAKDNQETLHADDLGEDMVLLGIMGMIDPPRPEAIDAVKACQTAGITVKMITGDHALTAQKISEQIGIGGRGPKVISGLELEKIPPEKMPEIAANTHVFARVAPEQKLRLVEALQAKEAVVAMTGDGVNDAPALKQANIGVAMGITGTEASKSAADMVLTDDNFASIEAAVEEGRGVYDNLRKFITWTLPTNGGEGLLILAAVAAGGLIPELPILPVQILWINMTTALMLGLMLAFEPREKGLMLRQPREPNEPIMTLDLIIRTAYVSVFMVIGAYWLFFYEQAHGLGTDSARTVACNVVVMVELVYLFNCRSLELPITRLGFFSNRWALLGAGGMILLQLIFTYAPFMQTLFRTETIPLITWLHIAMVALTVYFIVEIEKWIRRQRSSAKY